MERVKKFADAQLHGLAGLYEELVHPSPPPPPPANWYDALVSWAAYPFRRDEQPLPEELAQLRPAWMCCFSFYYHIAVVVLLTLTIAKNNYYLIQTSSRSLLWCEPFYLTNWNMLVLYVYFCGELWVDVCPYALEYLEGFQSRLFHSIVFPFTMLVVTLFWATAGENRFNNHQDQRYHDRFHHVVHAFLAPLVWVEGATTLHKMCPLLEQCLITVITEMAYIIWVYMFGLVLDVWPYKVLGQSSYLFQLAVIVLATFALQLYNCVERIFYNRYWGPELTID